METNTRKSINMQFTQYLETVPTIRTQTRNTNTSARHKKMLPFYRETTYREKNNKKT